MINKSRLKDALTGYKKYFETSDGWEYEKYKWEAVKCFQDNWNVNAEDFATMLHNSLDKTNNLLTALSKKFAYVPRQMIEMFAKNAPEEVRDMFKDLFDESKDVYDRIKEFKDKASNMHKKYGEKGKQHFQNGNAISTYLWLKYPDKYYIYKFGEDEKVAKELNSDFTYKKKKGADIENIRNTFNLYNEICEELKQDTELVKLFRSKLTNTCYEDPDLKTLAIDVAFYISRYYKQENASSVK